MSVIANLVARLTADTTAFDRNMQRSRRSLRDFTAESATTQRRLLGLARGALAFAGVGVGVYALKRALTVTVKDAASFEYQMARIHTMLDEGTERHLPQFQRAIERMSVEYGEGVEALTAGAYDILSASIAPAKAMEVLEANVRAAKGGFTDTATAVKASVGILNAYGMQAGRIGDVTNLMHKIVKRGVITFEELAQNIGTVTSLAAVLGVDLEAVGAAIATMTRAGISAEISMTALRSILNVFKSPTDEAKKAAAELGFTLDATSIQGSGLVTIMDKLRDANAEQLDALMPNVRGLVGFAAGLKNATKLGEDYRYMLSEVGAAEDAFAKAIATSQAQIDKTREAWKAAKREFGEATLPIVTNQLRKLTEQLEVAAWAVQPLAKALKLLWVPGHLWRGVDWLMEAPFGYREVGPQAHMDEFWRQMAEREARAPEVRMQEFWQQMAEQEARERQEQMMQIAQAPEFRLHGMPVVEATRNAYADLTTDVIQAYRAMFADMDRISEESYQVRMALLGYERTRYEKFIQDKVLMDRWFNEQREKAEIERLLASDKILDGVQAAGMQMDRELLTAAQHGAELTVTLRDGVCASLADAALEARDFGDAMEAVGKQMMRLSIEWLAKGTWSAAQSWGKTFLETLFGAGTTTAKTTHAGGTLGVTTFPTRRVPAAAFAAAPRLHAGLGTREFPAILEYGEKVTSRAGVAAENRQLAGVERRLDSLIDAGSRPVNLRLVLVDEREAIGEYMRGEQGEEIFVYHQRRNE